MEDFMKDMTEEKALLILERTRYLEDSDCELPEDFLSETDEEQPVCHQKQEREAGETCPIDPALETHSAVPRVEAYPSTSALGPENQTSACNHTYPQERCGTTVKEEPESEYQLSMNQADFLVKEESLSSNESWVDRLKQEPASPLSMDTTKEEPDEIENHDLNVKKEKLGKEEESDSSDEIIMSCSSEGLDHEFIRESGQCPHSECSAQNYSSQSASSATQSLSGDMPTMNCQRQFLKTSSSGDKNLIPVRSESEKPFAVVPPPSAGETMNKEETANVYLSKRHVVQQMAEDRQEDYHNKVESRSSPNDEDTLYRKSALQSSSLRSSTCKRSFKCNHCEKIFKTKKHLIQHMRIHSGDRPFKCSQCGKSFTQSSNLTTHLRIHSRDRPFKCSQCGKSFTQSNNLTRHMLRHTGERPFQCSHCGKSFPQRTQLTRHMLKHTGEWPFKCSQCGKSFTENGHLTRHMLKHTGEQPFKCSECGQSFAQSSHLTTHMFRHTGVRPFKCTQCEKSFIESGDLTKHLRIHTGERPFKCSQCRKSFTVSGDLTKHLRVHTGERPFKCSQCEKSFTRSGTLSKHLQVHTGESPLSALNVGNA